MPLPEALAPQLATLVDGVPPDGEWLYEMKFDGYRLLARVDGKSPADYLTPEQRPRVRDLARRLLTAPPATITDAWELLA